MTLRLGQGFDAHRFDFASSRPLMLATLEWEAPALAGHSDGDVAVHALVDALAAAAGLGDIGTLFGSGDPKYAGAASSTFLTETMALIRTAGYTVVNANVQVIGNRPALQPRRAEAQAALEALLEAPVNISATTTDGMGFTGRGEGLAAIASCLLRVNAT